MLTNGFRSILKYNLIDRVKTVGICFAILSTITVAVCVSMIFSTTDVSYSPVEVCVFVFSLVCGIVSVRESLRLSIQFGTGRRSAFFSETISAVVLALLAGILGEIMMAVVQSIFADRPDFTGDTLFQMLYPENAAAMSFAAMHFSSFMVCFLGGIAAFALGMFISVCFFRMSKTWHYIAGALTLVVAVNLVFGFGNTLEKVFTSPVFMMSALAVFTLVFFSASWLIARHADISK